MAASTSHNGRRVLVTGANGQLGKAIHAEAIGLDGVSFIYTDYDQLDITQKDSIAAAINTFKPELIVNCAAYTAVDKAEDEKELAFHLNAYAPGLLAELCKEHDIELIHISTDYVFDGASNQPYTETDKVNPLSVYGQSKLKGEELVLTAGNAMVIRTSWLYSAFGNNFLKTMIRYGSERSELRVVFDQTGTPTLANDLAKVLLQIVRFPHRYFIPGIYHYSNQGVCSWYDFAYEIVSTLNLKAKVIPITTNEYPTKAKRPQYSVLNKQKISNLLGADIPHWRKSLLECLEQVQKSSSNNP